MEADESKYPETLKEISDEMFKVAFRVEGFGNLLIMVSRTSWQDADESLHAFDAVGNTLKELCNKLMDLGSCMSPFLSKEEKQDGKENK